MVEHQLVTNISVEAQDTEHVSVGRKCNDVTNWQNDTFLLFDSARNTQLLCISSDGNDDKGNCSTDVSS